MILKTKILFNDVLAEKFGTDEKEIWGDFYLDLNEIIGFGSYVKDGEEYPELTEITIRNIGGRIIKIQVEAFEKIMISYNSESPWYSRVIV